MPVIPHMMWDAFSRFENLKNPPPGYRPHVCSIYVIEAGGAVKVGVALNVASRAKAIQTGNDRPIRIYWAVIMNRELAEVIERSAHDQLRDIAGAAGGTEWFYVAPETAVAVIKRTIVKEHFPCKRDSAYGFDRDLPGDSIDEAFEEICEH